MNFDNAYELYWKISCFGISSLIQLISWMSKFLFLGCRVSVLDLPLVSTITSSSFSFIIFGLKEDYLRFLSRVIGDENHFPTNKTLVWGAYNDQLLMPDNFAFMCWKNFISEKWPKMAFFGIFPISYRDQSTTSHSDLSLMIFTSHSDPVIFFFQCLSWWSGCHGYPAMTKKGLWEAPLTEFSPQTVQNLW